MENLLGGEGINEGVEDFSSDIGDGLLCVLLGGDEWGGGLDLVGSEHARGVMR